MKKKTDLILLGLLVLAISLIMTFLMFKNNASDSYEVITNMRFKTMLNDGGSNTSVYYQIDLKTKKVTKIQEDYQANLGGNGKTSKKTLYAKKISSSLKKEISSSLEKILAKEDIKGDNYSFYVIKAKNQSKEIYNEKTIKDIENLLNKIDNE